ncbi:7828_t:CDS:1 [Funneliformis mosseae]|uniref:7828_t:CDS:1 n=1 Tax=Funneliformis mosseae TaxID=27381 RepID=A0A9N9IAW7_FUNMO|nr:7828_t:CDS:1 [Funneliformis mosseae]
MNPQLSFDKLVVTKSKRGRKALAVSDDHVDLTGKSHIMTVKRSNPPTTKKKAPKAPKAVKESNNYCRRCEQNDEYIKVLNDRIGKLESLVKNTEIIDKPLSKIGTVDLFSLFGQINFELFNRFEMMQNQLQLQTQLATPTTLTPTNSDLIDRIEKMENFLNISNTPISQSPTYIEMQNQIQSQISTPTTTLALPYEPVDFANWSTFTQ